MTVIFVSCSICGADLTPSVVVDTRNGDAVQLKAPPHICQTQPAQPPHAATADDEIRKTAERAGFWGVDAWWVDSIPRFRSFLEAAQQPAADTGAGDEVPCQRCGKLPSQHIGFWWCYATKNDSYLRENRR